MNSSQHAHAVCQNGRRIHVLAQDERGQRLVEAGGNVNPPALQLWKRLASENWTHVIDVGANYGEMLVNLSWPDSTSLIAVEPNPMLVPLLERTMSEAGLQVQIVPKALSSVEASAQFQADRTWSGLSRLGKQPHPEGHGHEVEHIEVKVTTLASLLLDGNSPSTERLLLKVDVEGAECDVLRGLDPILEQLQDFACMIEVLHMPDEDLEWLVKQFRPEVFDPITNQLIPIHGDGRRLRSMLRLGIFHYQDVVVRRRARSGTQ